MMYIHRVGIFAFAFTLLSATAGPAQQQRKEGRAPFPPQHHYLLSLAYSPDGREVGVIGRDNIIRFWEAGTGKKVRSIEPVSH